MSEPELRDVRPYVPFTSELAKTICRRVAHGESVAAICEDAGMPNAGTVSRWARQRSAFRRALQRAREAAGWQYQKGKPAGWKEPSAEPVAAEVFGRLCEGEPLTSICADPRMPGKSTVYRWRKEWDAFGDAMSVARRVQAEALCEQGWDLAQAATPDTAYLTHVRLTHLRWMAGVFAPRFAGRLKTQEPERIATGDDGRPQTIFYARQFERVIGEDGKPTVREIPPPWLAKEDSHGR